MKKTKLLLNVVSAGAIGITMIAAAPVFGAIGTVTGIGAAIGGGIGAIAGIGKTLLEKENIEDELKERGENNKDVIDCIFKAMLIAMNSIEDGYLCLSDDNKAIFDSIHDEDNGTCPYLKNIITLSENDYTVYENFENIH